MLEHGGEGVGDGGHGLDEDIQRDADDVLSRIADGIADDGRQTPYRTYALLDARIAWERRHLRIYIDGNNITATRYCDFGGLKMPEGWFTGGLVVTY